MPVDPEVLTMCPILGDFTSVLVRDGAGARCFVGGEKDGFTRTQPKADINKGIATRYIGAGARRSQVL
jgi:hypothetical protein